ncbi:MAG: hydroxysqualene dehydroxylase HpnE [Jatrophihabitantaceae bacterium]
MAETVVVGGGLAGITAALRLADAGQSVVLLEGRPRLGGAAFSFRRGALTIDNGQHVFLRCCEHYRALLARLGATGSVALQPRLDIPVLHPDGRLARLGRTPRTPAPAHLALSLGRYGLLSPTDRARAVRGALALRRLDPADAALDRRSLGEFLRAHGQNDATIEALWSIVGTATLNLRPDDASLALAAKVFRTGLLDRAGAADVGVAAVPLGELHSVRARSELERAGVEVLASSRVEAVEPGGSGVVVRARSENGGTARAWHAGAVVLAVPPRDAFAVLPSLTGTPARAAAGLGATAIVNVHVIYDRRVTDLPFAAAVASPVQWFFDRTVPAGLAGQHPGQQYLAVTVSAADDIVATPTRVLQEQFVAALAALLPTAASARVLDVFVTRERRATFRQAPGSAALRPSCESGVPRVWLAGSWTATGWPDTMEGAVRSGDTAAQAVLASSSTRVGQEAAA